MSRALILTYNIRRSLFELGVKAFYTPREFKMPNRTKVSIIPVVTNLGDNVEFRAKELARLVPNLLTDLNCDTCDLVSFSLSGIDARFALARLGLSKYVKNLVTVGSPHMGSKLAWLSERQILPDKTCQPISRLLGVGLRPFWEVAPENMKNFNRVIRDVPETNYFSIGAERLPTNMKQQLRQTGNYLRLRTEANFVYENDGVFGHDECMWTNHLVNFEADHSQLVGAHKFLDLNLMTSLIHDAINSEASAHQ